MGGHIKVHIDNKTVDYTPYIHFKTISTLNEMTIQEEFGVPVDCLLLYEPRHEKTGLRGFQPGLTQTDLYSHRSRLET